MVKVVSLGGTAIQTDEGRLSGRTGVAWFCFQVLCSTWMSISVCSWQMMPMGL